MWSQTVNMCLTRVIYLLFASQIIGAINPTLDLSQTGRDIISQLKQNIANLPRPNHKIPVKISKIPENLQTPTSTSNNQLNMMWNDTIQKQQLSYLHNTINENDFTDCTNLYVEHNAVLGKLQDFIFEARKTVPTPNFNIPKRLLFIRKITIYDNLHQELFFNPDSSKLMINISNMKLVNLDKFINWLHAQIDLTKIMLSTESSMTDLFRINYTNLVPPTTTTEQNTNFDVITFEPYSGLLRKPI